MKKFILFLAFFFTFTHALQAKETLLEKEIASCQRIGYPDWRDDCFESLDKSKKNYALCLKITNKERQALCVAVHPPENIADCQLNQTPKEIDSCLITLRQATQDFFLCKKISDPALRKDCYACSSNAKDVSVCLEFRAKQLHDKTICDLLSSSSAKSNCLLQMNTKSTVVGCEEPQNLLDFKLCKQFTIAQNEEIKNAKKSIRKEKTQKLKQPTEIKTQKKAEKLQQEKDKQTQKIQEAKDKQDALKAEKEAKIQQAKDEKTAKIQQDKEKQATKIRREKEKRDIKAQESAEKIQQAKDKQAQRIQEAKDKQDALKAEKEAKIQQAKDQQAALKAEKEEKIQQAKDQQTALKAEKEAKIQQAKDAKKNKSVEKTEKISKPKENNVGAEVPDIKNALVEDTEEEFSGTMSYSKPSVDEISEKPQEPAISAPIKIEKSSKINAQEKSDKINKAKEIKAQEKADKVRKAKEDQAAKAQEKADKLRKAKEEQAAKAQEKADKAKKAKETRLNAKKITLKEESYEIESNQFHGCTKGFGTWTEPPPSKNEQMICDKENIEQFKPLVNRCLTTDRSNVLIMSYDVNKDGCVTCADLNQWKAKVKDLYHAKKRLTDARYLYVKECQDRKF